MIAGMKNWKSKPDIRRIIAFNQIVAAIR